MKKFIISLLFIFNLQAQNKIICVISIARSLSTIFMRTFEGRNDTTIFHEPSIRTFVEIKKPQWNITFNDSAFKTHKEMMEFFLEKNKISHLLIKEIVPIIDPFLQTHTDFIKKPNIYFVFLLRNPHDTLVSVYKRTKNHNGIRNKKYYSNIHNLFTLIKKEAIHKPVIILSEDFGKNPQKTLQQLCKHVGIEYQKEMLDLKDLGDNFDGSLWHEQKTSDHVYHWHSAAIRSTSITSLKNHDKDENGYPTFIEIEESYRTAYKGAYEDNLPYYNSLMKETEYFLEK